MHNNVVPQRNSKDQDRVDPLPVSRDLVKRPVPEKYEFGAFRLEPVERKLLRGSEVVALTPKAFDTLHVLVRNSGHLVEKEELIRLLWPDTFVEEGTLTNNIFLIRKALGEDVAYIETVPKRGYRFVGAIRQTPHVVEGETSQHGPPGRTGAPQRESPATRHSGSRIPAFISIFVVVVGLTLVVLLLGNRHRAPVSRTCLRRVQTVAGGRLGHRDWSGHLQGRRREMGGPDLGGFRRRRRGRLPIHRAAV